MSLLRIKTERERGEEGKKRGKGREALRCGFAQPLAMTNWSNYAWRLWHWLWHQLFCWSAKMQTCAITQYNTHKRIHTSSLPTKHSQGHIPLFWRGNTGAHRHPTWQCERFTVQAGQQKGKTVVQPHKHNHYLHDLTSYKPEPLTRNYTPPPTSLSTALFDTWVQINSVKIESDIDFWAERAFVGADLNVCNFTCAA